MPAMLWLLPRLVSNDSTADERTIIAKFITSNSIPENQPMVINMQWFQSLTEKKLRK